jgi:hypothetical protein
VHIIGVVLVIDNPELQVQEGNTGGRQEGRIEHARAYVEADELFAISRVVFRNAQGRGVAQVPRPWRQNEAGAGAGVGKEAGGDAVGDERDAVAVREGTRRREAAQSQREDGQVRSLRLFASAFVRSVAQSRFRGLYLLNFAILSIFFIWLRKLL